MKVLLISPLDPQVPKPGNLKWLSGGENTFTKMLLESPPKNVEYVHFQEALKLGQIEWGGFYPLFRLLVKLRLVPLSPGVLDLKLVGHFDLVHVHVFSVRLTGNKVPVVVSDSSDNLATLRGYFKWSEWRIKVVTKIRFAIIKIFKVIDPSTEGNKLVVFSHYAKFLHGGRATVLYPGIADIAGKKIRHKTINLIFVGTWFERKGGRQVIEAFRNLQCKMYNLQLIIVGEVPKDVDLTGIEHYSWLTRQELMNKVFAKGDILIHLPSHEGFGFVVVEAMMWGLPAVVTNVGALAEMVASGESGWVIPLGNRKLVYERLIDLINNKELRLQMGKAARKRYERVFSAGVASKKWQTIYEERAGDRWKL